MTILPDGDRHLAGASTMVTSMTSNPCWHQWQFHQQSPPLSLMTTTHAPPMSMLPFCLHLSLCFHFSPFGINGKGCPHTCVWDLWSLLTAPPINMHNPRTCLYVWTPLSSFSSLMNSRCSKVFERPYTWLAIWQPSSLLWSTSLFCSCSVFLIHTCFLASVLWAFDPSSVLAFLDEL